MIFYPRRWAFFCQGYYFEVELLRGCKSAQVGFLSNQHLGVAVAEGWWFITLLKVVHQLGIEQWFEVYIYIY
jgi:hypothetical protein